MSKENIVIFISHSKDDETLAISLKRFLENIFLNADFFVSGSDLGGGNVWIEELRQKLESATAIIALVTPYAVDNKWVYFEAGAGFAKRRSIPLLADGVTFQSLPIPLSLLQGRMYDAQGLKSLVLDISELAEMRTPARFPGLEEILVKANDFMEQRRAEKEKAPRVAKSHPKEKEVAEDEDDASLKEEITALIEKTHHMISSAILKNQDVYDVPSREELEGLNLIDLRQIAETIGLKPPFTASSLLIMNMTIPKTTDSKWKKQNFKAQLCDIAKDVAEFESKQL